MFKVGDVVVRVGSPNGQNGARRGQKATVVHFDRAYVYVSYPGCLEDGEGGELWGRAFCELVAPARDEASAKALLESRGYIVTLPKNEKIVAVGGRTWTVSPSGAVIKSGTHILGMTAVVLHKLHDALKEVQQEEKRRNG